MYSQPPSVISLLPHPFNPPPCTTNPLFTFCDPPSLICCLCELWAWSYPFEPGGLSNGYTTFGFQNLSKEEG